MRVSFLFAALVAFVTGLAAVSMIPSLAHGQAPNQPASNGGASAERHPTSVAVVDIKFIFDNHQRFKSSMDEIKKDYDAFEAGVKETETSLRRKLEELKGMPAGSEAFKRLEEDVAQTRTSVQLDIGRRQKQRVEAEAKVYFRAYEEVEAQIRNFAERYGIDLVLQFSTTEIDPSKPDTVIRGLNRQVVYQRQLNITEYILKELNRAPQVPAVSGTQPPVRPNVGPVGGTPPAVRPNGIQTGRPPVAPNRSLK